MNLASILSDDFDSSIRNRGKIYYWQSRVRIRRGTDREVQASVRGSRTYDVNLDWTDGTLSLDCDCDYFDTVGPCKHLWATVLAADAKGYLAQAKGAFRVARDYGEEEADGGAAGVDEGEPPARNAAPQSVELMPQPALDPCPRRPPGCPTST